MAGGAGRVHMIGIGGAGMSAVAHLLASKGVPVSGSDGADGPYVRALVKEGIEVRIGHDPSAVEGAAEVIVSTAIRDMNPELVAARAAGIPIVHRSEGLARAVQGMRLVAIAGAHGKTTVTSMAGHLLHEAGMDPTVVIGGRLSTLGSHARLGQGEYLVRSLSSASATRYSPWGATPGWARENTWWRKRTRATVPSSCFFPPWSSSPT